MGKRRTLFLLALWLSALVGLGALPHPAQAAGCSELVLNGGFESNTGWTIANNPYPPGYSATHVHTGTQAMRLGLDGAQNIRTFSSIQQDIALPANARQITLSFWAYTVAENTQEDDRQEMILFRPDGAVLTIPWRTLTNGQTWEPHTVDLTAYAGQTVRLYFNAYNNGSGGRAVLYLDDVSVQWCDDATPTVTTTATLTAVPATPSATPVIIVVTNTPTPIILTATPTTAPTGTATPTSAPPPTFTPTPLPANCGNLLRDGGFESGDGWELGMTPRMGVFVRPPSAFSGAFSLRLGNDSLDDVASFSSARQTVFLPASGDVLRLSFMHSLLSEETGTSDDHQEVLLLDPQTEAIVAVLWRVLRHDPLWLETTIDLTPYRGRTYILYFNVYNDGNGRRTALYLDNVALIACPLPTATPTITATPTVTPTPTREPTRAAGGVGLAPTRTPTPTPGAPSLAADEGIVDLIRRNLVRIGAVTLVVGAGIAGLAALLALRREM